MQLCDYGCGNEATYQFKNGNWCCNKITLKCPSLIKQTIKRGKNRITSDETRKKLSEANKGRIVSDQTKNKISNTLKGHSVSQETRKKLRNSLKGRKIIFTKEHKKNLSLSQIGRPGSNKGKKFSKEHKKNISKSLVGKKFTKQRLKIHIKAQRKRNKNTYYRFSIEDYKNKYPTFAKVEEMRYNPYNLEDKEIQVRCKNNKCINSKEKDGWFTPGGDYIDERKRQIERGDGGFYFYCSEKCKQECPLYGKTASQLIKEDLIAAGHIEDPWYTSSEYQEWRQHIFELDNGLCVYCGQPAIIAHHILPQKTHPELSLDPENGLSCCIDCHYKYGHRDSWCTTGKLGALVCERIIKMKNK